MSLDRSDFVRINVTKSRLWDQDNCKDCYFEIDGCQAPIEFDDCVEIQDEPIQFSKFFIFKLSLKKKLSKL